MARQDILRLILLLSAFASVLPSALPSIADFGFCADSGLMKDFNFTAVSVNQAVSGTTLSASLLLAKPWIEMTRQPSQLLAELTLSERGPSVNPMCTTDHGRHVCTLSLWNSNRVLHACHNRANTHLTSWQGMYDIGARRCLAKVRRDGEARR